MKITLKFLCLTVLTGLLITTTGVQYAFAQDKRITCESYNGDYNYCRVDTNNKVKLVSKLSSSDCWEGSSWGYDNRGIWVDRGCRAEFAYGGGGSSAKGAAIAGGIIGGIILAGVLASRNNRHKETVSNSGTVTQLPSGSSSSNSVPKWLVGTYNAVNRGAKYPWINVYADGSVWTSNDGNDFDPSGSYYDSTLQINNREYRVIKDGNGFLLRPANDNNKQDVYDRVN